MSDILFKAKAIFNGTIGSDKEIEGTNIHIAPSGDTKRLHLNGVICDYNTLEIPELEELRKEVDDLKEELEIVTHDGYTEVLTSAIETKDEVIKKFRKENEDLKEHIKALATFGKPDLQMGWPYMWQEEIYKIIQEALKSLEGENE